MVIIRINNVSIGSICPISTKEGYIINKLLYILRKNIHYPYLFKYSYKENLDFYDFNERI